MTIDPVFFLVGAVIGHALAPLLILAIKVIRGWRERRRIVAQPPPSRLDVGRLVAGLTTIGAYGIRRNRDCNDPK